MDLGNGMVGAFSCLLFACIINDMWAALFSLQEHISMVQPMRLAGYQWSPWEFRAWPSREGTQGNDVSTAGGRCGCRKDQSEVGQRPVGDVNRQEVKGQEGGAKQVNPVFTEKSPENRVWLPRKRQCRHSCCNQESFSCKEQKFLYA